MPDKWTWNKLIDVCASFPSVLPGPLITSCLNVLGSRSTLGYKGKGQCPICPFLGRSVKGGPKSTGAPVVVAAEGPG